MNLSTAAADAEGGAAPTTTVITMTTVMFAMHAGTKNITAPTITATMMSAMNMLFSNAATLQDAAGNDRCTRPVQVFMDTVHLMRLG